MWPFSRREPRAGALTGETVPGASNPSPYSELTAETIGAVESASGIIARALSIGTPNPVGARTACLTASMLHTTGRELIRRGEALWALDVVGGQTVATPVSYFDVQGRGTDPLSWWYRIDLPSPDGSYTELVPASQVLHFKYQTSLVEPWRGISPLKASPTTARLAARIEGGLGDESNVPSGMLIPASGTPDQFSEAQSNFRDIDVRGKVATIPLQRGGWGSEASPQSQSVTVQRVGPAPPAGLVDLRRDAILSIFSLMGVPHEMSSLAEGAASREAWRRFLHGTIAPLGANLAIEASMKLGTEVSFNFDKLFASDLAGRARAFQSMVGGGIDVSKAANLSGLMSDDG